VVQVNVIRERGENGAPIWTKSAVLVMGQWVMSGVSSGYLLAHEGKNAKKGIIRAMYDILQNMLPGSKKGQSN
jgi:hypothetical protein